MTKQTIREVFDLTGKGAVVTGSGSGIGQAVALRLAEAGANLMIADVDLTLAKLTAERIVAAGGKAIAIYADVANVDDATKVVQHTVESFGSIDILVNNAGIFPFCSALDTTEVLWDKVMAVNLKGVFFYSQAAARQMITIGRGGRIINMGSTDSFHPTMEVATYDASKGGVLMLTKSLALEWAQFNILVNAVAPGGITTPGILERRRAVIATGVSEQEIVAKRMARQPLGRTGEADDIAKAVLFLASGAADYITGTMMLVDGGYLLS